MNRRVLFGATVILCLLACPAGGRPEADVKPGGKRGPITVHVLDTSAGRPAAEVAVVLERAEGERWQEMGRGRTDADGRAGALVPAGGPLRAGTYRLTYDGVARSVGASLAPALAGWFLGNPALLGMPFFLAGGIKIVYDLLLYRSFVSLRAPEEMGDGRGERRT